MGAKNSSLTTLNCILKNGDRFDPQGLKKTHLIFLCDTAWPLDPLEDSKWWLVGGSLKYNTVLQLDPFCRKQWEWVEVAYVLPFFSLWNMPDLGPKGIDLGVKTSAPSCPPTLLDEMEDRRQRDKEKQVSPIYPWDHKYTEQPERLKNSHTSCCLFMKHPPGEIISLWELISLFLIKKYKKIKEDLGDYLYNPEKYIRAFKGVTLLYDLTWKDVMYVLGKTLTPESKTRVLGKVVAYGDE